MYLVPSAGCMPAALPVSSKPSESGQLTTSTGSAAAGATTAHSSSSEKEPEAIGMPYSSQLPTCKAGSREG